MTFEDYFPTRRKQSDRQKSNFYKIIEPFLYASPSTSAETLPST